MEFQTYFKNDKKFYDIKILKRCMQVHVNIFFNFLLHKNKFYDDEVR